MLCQITFMIYPGKQPVYYYICMGKYPEELQHIPTKFNFSLYLLLFLSFLIHVLIITCLKVHKFQHKKEGTPMASLNFGQLRRHVNEQVLFRYIEKDEKHFVKVSHAVNI